MHCECRSQQLCRLWAECLNVLHRLLSIPSSAFDEDIRRRFPTIDANAVQSLVSVAGPCPRDLITYVTRPSRFDYAVKLAVECYSDSSHLVRLFSRMDELSRHESHALVLVRRCEPLSPTDLKDDRCIVSFKSPYVYQKMLDNVLTLQMDEIRELYRAVRGFTAHGAAFAGFLFQCFVILSTRSQFQPDNPTLGVFTRMSGAETRSTKFPTRFVYKRDSRPQRPLTIVVQEDRRIILKCSPTGPSQSAASTHLQPPWSERFYVSYTSVENLRTIDSSSYYCPSALNNPLFDAFFFEVTSPAHVVLWVLQMMIKREHTGVPSGFEMISELRQRACDEWPGSSVEVKYVLIVPHEHPGYDVE